MARLRGSLIMIVPIWNLFSIFNYNFKNGIMKWYFYIISCFYIFPVFSQSIYTSSYTQTWPTIFNSKVEKIDHRISFEENAISLAKETGSGKEIETFFIQEIQQNEISVKYICLTRGNEKVMVVKPLRKLTYIDIYRPSAKTGEEVQFRLHLNN